MQIVENMALHFTAPANLVDQLYQVIDKAEIVKTSFVVNGYAVGKIELLYKC